MVTKKTFGRKKNAPAEEPLFQCIGMLAQAVGPMLTKILHDQLDLMFSGGLNEPLRQALVAIEEHIKPLRRTVQGTSATFLVLCLSSFLTRF
jgi:FKBP12-rapamycin complex-associated protein